ncbi:MAG: glycosyltransferase family 4 protein [Nanoarchaeota archaeon]|nr:glycosyltransferase family 4 protein [Nanoarchaeota archaeon]
MKVAFYSPTVLTLDGGIENFILNSCDKLTKFCNVSLIAGMPLVKRGVKLPRKVKIHYFDYMRRSQMEKFQLETPFPMECASFFVNSVKHLMENKYDVIHINKPTDIIIKSYIKTPIVVHLHDETIKKQAFLYKKYQGDKYVACSKYIADKNKKIVKKKIDVVHNGVDTKFFSPKKHKKKNDDINLFTIGRLVHYKNFQTLIKAFKYVEKENKKIKLNIGGKGIYEKNLRDLVKRLNLKNIKFLGRLPQNALPNYYSNADLFVNPRIAEPFGIVFLEAMACGTPVIGGKEGGPKEFVTNDIGFLADNRDPKDIAKKILKAADSDLEKMGKNARKKVEKEFTWDVVAKRLYEAYKEVV